MWPSHPSRVLTLIAACVALVVSLVWPAAARADTARVPTGGELAAFFDTNVPQRLASANVPGAVVSVVGDGRLLFSKGYGLADRENRTPFDAGASLVRIASITKLFTWTAVMQLVQQGKLDLNQDVNRYLTAFHVPATYAKPITLLDLMDHTAGFEDRVMGVGARTKADVPPLGTFLAEHMPARVRPPGEVSAYSNYGAALAGYIVSQVSGQPYDQYVYDHILAPLGMRHSTASEPVPAPLAAGQARSYDYDDGVYTRKPFVFDNMAPDGSISATADDMAKFMIAHLKDGAGILDPSTARLMHQRSFAADPRIDGYAHGFKEMTLNGHRVIMHDGGWEAFESALLLVPDAGIGLFISANSGGSSSALAELVPAFFDRFLPGDRTAAKPGATTAPATDGFYRPARAAQSTVEKLLILTTSGRLRVEAGGRVAFQGRTWTPLSPGLYQQDGGDQRLAFVTAGSGTYVATDGTAFERSPWSDTPPVNLVIIVLFLVTALTAVLGLPVAALVRLLRKRRPPSSRAWRVGRLLAGLGGAIGLVFVVQLTLALVGGTSILYGPPASLRVLFLLPPLFLALTVAATVATVTAWRRPGIGILARGHQVAVLVGLLALTWFCLHWNLVGWQFG